MRFLETRTSVLPVPAWRKEWASLVGPAPPTSPVFQSSITPPLHHPSALALQRPRPPSKIPCNLWLRFPLYGVEAGSLPAKLAQRKADGADEISSKPATNMARATKDESNPATPGRQGCGEGQHGRRGLARQGGRRFAGAMPNERSARARTTKCRAFGISLLERCSSQREPGHSSAAGPSGNTRREALTFIARTRPFNVRRTGEDLTRQGSALLFPLGYKRIEISKCPFGLASFRGRVLSKFSIGCGSSMHSYWVSAQPGRRRRKASCTCSASRLWFPRTDLSPSLSNPCIAGSGGTPI
jgi:hypothetical protein